MNLTNELTSESDWDNNWKDFQPAIIEESDNILGRNGAFLKTLDQRFHIPDHSSFLELGGACSAYLCSLAKFKKAKASVIDYSNVGLNKTNSLFELNGCNVDVHQGDIFTYNFDEQKFDYIVHWGLIEHFKNPSEIFELSHKLLNKSGATFLLCQIWKLWVHLYGKSMIQMTTIPTYFILMNIFISWHMIQDLRSIQFTTGGHLYYLMLDIGSKDKVS